MATIKTYFEFYKNSSFEEVPFNDIDNLLFTELSYLDWSNIVSNTSKKITLQEASEKFLKREKGKSKKKFRFIRSIIENLKEIKDSKRYKDCYLAHFQNNVDTERQFGAICIYFEPHKVYVSFQGTDDSIIGWKEDFQMAYLFPIMSQRDSVKYLNEVITWQDKKVFVGGHSKGGNLAMCAYMYCKDSIKRKVDTVYNIDGPGFREIEFNSKRYKDMLPKLKTYLPEESIFGRLLYTSPNYKVIKSIEKGVWQHDINSWKCFGMYLEEGKLTESSKKLGLKISEWLKKYEDNEIEKLVLTFFNILEKVNVTCLDDFKHIELSKVTIAVNEVKNIDPEIKKLYIEALKSLLISSNK